MHHGHCKRDLDDSAFICNSYKRTLVVALLCLFSIFKKKPAQAKSIETNRHTIMYCTSSTLFPFFLILLLLDRAAAKSCGNVTHGCGSHGTCHLNTRSCGNECLERCICDDGFSGNDCSMRIEICPDAVAPSGSRSCLHGGVCRLDNATAEDWSCDCAKAKKGSTVYAGHQCEFPADVSCEVGTNESSHAFCTNNGTCQSQVESGQHHLMCYCTYAFEGRHCQYAKGTLPDQETVYAIPQPQSNQGISGGAIAVLVILSLIVVVAAVVFYRRPKRRQAANKASNNVPNDLNLKTFNETDPNEPPMASIELI